MPAVAVDYPTITRDAVLDGMVAALSDAVPATGAAVTSDKPFRSVGRYMGELSSVEAFKRGVAGRCPAVRMAFSGDRSIRTTISRRIDYVEGSFAAVVFSDSSKSKDDRAVLLGLCDQVQRLVGARRFGLEIKPLRHRTTAEFPGLEHCTAYGVQFMTRYRVDYTKEPGADTMQSASGEIIDAATTRSPRPKAPTLAAVGTPGSTARSYALVGLDAAGLPTLLGDVATIGTSAATLNSTDKVRLSWAAIPGIATYQIARTASAGSPATVGVIGATALLTFDDTGLAPTAGVPEIQKHDDLVRSW